MLISWALTVISSTSRFALQERGQRGLPVATVEVSSKPYHNGSWVKNTETGLRPTHLSGNSHGTDGDISLFREQLAAWDVDLLLSTFSTSVWLSHASHLDTHTDFFPQQTWGVFLVFLVFFEAEIPTITRIQIWTQIPNPSPSKFPHLILGRCSQTPNLNRHRDPSACQNGKIVGFSYQLLRNHCIHGAIDRKGIAKNTARFSGSGYQSNGASPNEATPNKNIWRN